MTRTEESWFLLASQRSSSEEAAQHDRLLAAARAAADCGRVWLSAPRGLAAQSESLRLAVAVSLHCEGLRVVASGLRSSSWIRLAEDAATADGLCGGRLELAFDELPDAGVVERLRGAWSGARVELPGADGQSIEVHPRPVRREGPPLWAAVASPAEAGRAARLDLGSIVGDPASARAHLESASDGMPPPVAMRTAAPRDLPEDLAGVIALSQVVLE